MMTLKESLEICHKMWSWLAANPSKDKSDAIAALDLPYAMPSECSCCKYVTDNFGKLLDCNRCPLVEFWKKNGDPGDIKRRSGKLSFQDYCCCSTYTEWQHATSDVVRTHKANQIANAAQQELDKLQHENTNPKQQSAS